MDGFVWFTALESAEEVGIPLRRIAMIEQKARGEGLVVAIHLDGGKEIRVVDSLERVRDLLAAAGGDPIEERDPLAVPAVRNAPPLIAPASVTSRR